VIQTDVAVVGGGILGTATALALAEGAVGGRRSVVVLEAEERLAAHQSGHNSGVVHSGLYYKPGSLKARLCVTGARALYRFCEEEGIACRRVGKLVVATRAEELPKLDELERRGRANGLAGLRRLDVAGIREIEPAAVGIAALHVPESGVADFPAVVRAYARRVQAAGGEVWTGARLLGVRRDAGVGGTGAGVVLETSRGALACRLLVNCAGLQSDRVARLCGERPDVRIVPFRGEYYEIGPPGRDLVRGLIYPVPDPRFPFLGVHLNPTVDGRVEAGPNAVMALKREGYRWRDVSPRDLAATAAWPGTWRLAAKFWRTGIEEVWRSLVRAAFLRDLQRLVPGLRDTDLQRGGSGVRAQALDRDGGLVDDFRILRGAPGGIAALHVLNAPSPGATASLAIGGEIAAMAREMLPD
jgi:(S)-2-hydroxyglutarate dehydrogenase